MSLEYRSIADMNEAILNNLHKLPHDIDLVVGIPRSGMLPANLIALYLNKSYTDIDSFIEGRIYSSGERGKNLQNCVIKKVLIMDDSLHSGNALNKAKEKLSDIIRKKKYDILFGVVYIIERNKQMIDFYCEVTGERRIFQWNFFHHSYYLKDAYFDIDGVLCPNPPQDDDGPIYLDYIRNAPVLFKPSCEIDTLVSCRLEKYRKTTEDWLIRNEIKYKKLIMLDLPDKETRIKWGKHGVFKGKIYKDSNAPFFVESSYREAKDILRISKKTVFCVETMTMMNYKRNPFFEKLKRAYWKLGNIIHCS